MILLFTGQRTTFWSRGARIRSCLQAMHAKPSAMSKTVCDAEAHYLQSLYCLMKNVHGSLLVVHWRRSLKVVAVCQPAASSKQLHNSTSAEDSSWLPTQAHTYTWPSLPPLTNPCPTTGIPVRRHIFVQNTPHCTTNTISFLSIILNRQISWSLYPHSLTICAPPATKSSAELSAKAQTSHASTGPQVLLR